MKKLSFLALLLAFFCSCSQPSSPASCKVEGEIIVVSNAEIPVDDNSCITLKLSGCKFNKNIITGAIISDDMIEITPQVAVGSPVVDVSDIIWIVESIKNGRTELVLTLDTLNGCVKNACILDFGVKVKSPALNKTLPDDEYINAGNFRYTANVKPSLSSMTISGSTQKDKWFDNEQNPTETEITIAIEGDEFITNPDDGAFVENEDVSFLFTNLLPVFNYKVKEINSTSLTIAVTLKSNVTSSIPPSDDTFDIIIPKARTINKNDIEIKGGRYNIKSVQRILTSGDDISIKKLEKFSPKVVYVSLDGLSFDVSQFMGDEQYKDVTSWFVANIDDNIVPLNSVESISRANIVANIVKSKSREDLLAIEFSCAAQQELVPSVSDISIAQVFVSNMPVDCIYQQGICDENYTALYQGGVGLEIK